MMKSRRLYIFLLVSACIPGCAGNAVRWRGDTAFAAGDLDRAAADYRAELRTSKLGPKGRRRHRDRALYRLALSCLKRPESAAESRRALEELLRHHPESRYYARARALFAAASAIASLHREAAAGDRRVVQTELRLARIAANMTKLRRNHEAQRQALLAQRQQLLRQVDALRSRLIINHDRLRVLEQQLEEIKRIDMGRRD